MNASQTRSSDSVLWDLSDLYASPEDPRIASDQAALTDQAAAFARRYKGRLADLTPDELASLLVAYEELTDALGKLGSFAYLLWSTDTENPVHGHLLQRITEFSSDISQALVFFDVEYQAVPDERIAVWLASPAISKWRFYLDSTRRYKPHTLS